MRVIFTIICTCCMLFLTSCLSESQTCISNETAYIDSVFVPKTGVVNQDIPIQFYYGIHNGCGKFDGFQISEEGNMLFCQVRVAYDGCQCTSVYFTEQKTYNFKTTSPGTYLFKYLMDGNQYAIDTLVVK